MPKSTELKVPIQLYESDERAPLQLRLSIATLSDDSGAIIATVDAGLDGRIRVGIVENDKVLAVGFIDSLDLINAIRETQAMPNIPRKDVNAFGIVITEIKEGDQSGQG